jgi:hypothetical protein
MGREAPPRVASASCARLSLSLISIASADDGDHQADRVGGGEHRPITGDEDEVSFDHLQEPELPRRRPGRGPRRRGAGRASRRRARRRRDTRRSPTRLSPLDGQAVLVSSGSTWPPRSGSAARSASRAAWNSSARSPRVTRRRIAWNADEPAIGLPKGVADSSAAKA